MTVAEILLAVDGLFASERNSPRVTVAKPS